MARPKQLQRCKRSEAASETMPEFLLIYSFSMFSLRLLFGVDCGRVNQQTSAFKCNCQC